MLINVYANFMQKWRAQAIWSTNSSCYMRDIRRSFLDVADLVMNGRLCSDVRNMKTGKVNVEWVYVCSVCILVHICATYCNPSPPPPHTETPSFQNHNWGGLFFNFPIIIISKKYMITINFGISASYRCQLLFEPREGV